MGFANWKNFSQTLQSGVFGFRSYGTTIAKGPVKEHALKLRGKIPAEKTDYRLCVGAFISISCFGIARWYASHRRDEIKRQNYLQMVNSNMGESIDGGSR